MDNLFKPTSNLITWLDRAMVLQFLTSLMLMDIAFYTSKNVHTSYDILVQSMIQQIRLKF